MTVLIRYQPDGSVLLKSPYDPAFLEDFKRLIGYRHREWRADEKVWWVASREAQTAIDICEAWFDAVVVIPCSPAEPPAARVDPDYGALHLLPSAPLPVVEAAYRALSKMNHPDVAGDEETMKRINGAYAKIKVRTG